MDGSQFTLFRECLGCSGHSHVHVCLPRQSQTRKPGGVLAEVALDP